MHEDLRTAIRSLRKSPSFTAVALIVLALGIGAGTAIFSVVDAVVLRALPFEEHDRLAVVLEHDPTRPATFGGGTTTPQMYLDWRAMQQSFDGLAAVGGWSFRVRNEHGEPADAPGQVVTWEFFPALRVKPLLGRTFTADDEIDGRHRVVVLSHGYWQRRFGGAPDVIGRTVEMSEDRWEIIGVLPRGFSYPVASARPAEMFAPVHFRSDEKTRGENRNYNWTVLGRLKDGVSLRQAHDQMNRVTRALGAQYPKWSPEREARVITLHEHLVGRVRGWMLMLLGAVALVLLIACANVANLMLARATTRTREIGIRAALGASRWRLIRALLVEGVVLSLAGAVLGVLLANTLVRVLVSWLPAGLPRVAAIGIDLRVLLAAVAAAGFTGIFFGLVPALQTSRPDLTAALKEGGRSMTAGGAGHRVRSALVVAEVALAVVLLVGAGLFIGSFVRLLQVDPGIDYRHVLTFQAYVPTAPGVPPAEMARRGGPYVNQLLDAVGRVPGVQMAAVVSGGLPLTGQWSRTRVALPGRELTGDDDSVDRRSVTPDYLALLGVPLRRGRYLTRDDAASTERVVVINDAAARKYWPGQDAIGQRITVNGTERVVVGTVGDIRHLGPETPARPEVYLPFAQDQQTGGWFVLKTAADPLRVLPAVKAAVWSVNPEQRFSGDTFTLEAYMDRLIAQRRFNMAMLALFGLLGLVIAAVGIYGVMAYVVAQRTSEIGIRMALGATAGAVVTMVLGRAAGLMAAGLAIGGAGAWYLSTGVKSFLFQVEPNDLGIFAAALASLAAVGLLASVIPARRAAAIDPLLALRHD